MSTELDALFAKLGEPAAHTLALAEQADLLQPDDQPAGPPAVAEGPVLDVRKHVRRHEAISEEILSSWRADREEAQQAINTIRDIVDDAVQKQITPSGTVLEAYVGAIKAKIDTNATAVNLLTATARLLQTAKPTVNIKQQNTTNYNELTAILSDPIAADDV